MIPASIGMTHYFAKISFAYTKSPYDSISILQTQKYSTAGFTTSGTYSSTIQYRCQKNFILMVTDGQPNSISYLEQPSPILGNAGSTLPVFTA